MNGPGLALSITKAASKQTYSTIRLLVDHERVANAYRAYAYFRWVDDSLDADSGIRAARIQFLERQKLVLESSCRGEPPRDANIMENMLVELAQANHEQDSGLQTYLRNMMLVMDFDARRRGRLISQTELEVYTYWLASAVTEAMHYFIGNGWYAPNDETRYLAVSAAHITHMLRDTIDDVEAGYYNIPREVLAANYIGPQDVHSEAYRAWVSNRVALARRYFEVGRDYLLRVQCRRCRLAGFAYITRFKRLLDTFERDGCQLRPQYDERKRLGASLRISWQTFADGISWRGAGSLSRSTAPQPPGER